MQSVMKHQFSQIPRIEIPRSVFNRSHGHKTTFDAGDLVPIYCDEALPGDTFTARNTIFARLATPIVPIMDNLFLDTFYFAVPNRLVWDNWQKFCGEQEDPDDPTDFLIPQIDFDGSNADNGTIWDHMGVPTEVADPPISALWARAYNLIYNTWFRDQNMQDSLEVPKDDGPDDYSMYTLRKRGKRHDYFTSCLPWPQKGPGVEIPLGTTAPVIGTGYQLGLNDGNADLGLTQSDAYNAQYRLHSKQLRGTDVSTSGVQTVHDVAVGVSTDPTESGLIADLSVATAATINALREAWQIQRLYERDARGGTRYTELVRSHFGVISPDARLQRPEFLGGSTARININPVAQTSSTDVTTPQGNLSGFGVVADGSGGFNKSFTEHTIIIGLACVRADLTYQQGIPRMFSRRTRFDYYWPALAHLGEQEVLNKEIFYSGVPATDDAVFGYQERWAEYRYFPSQITGKFRSNYSTPLDFWHLSQEFATLPTLNEDFIVENVPLDRVIAVPSEPHILYDSYMDLRCARPMPVYGVPGLVDHF